MAAGFSTGNVIRMSVLAREEEITIMRLVGASESSIRTPLLVEGRGPGPGRQRPGGAGACWPSGCPWTGAWATFRPLLVELARMGFFSIRNMAALAGVGMVTGALGALWGFWNTQRALRQMEAMMQERGA